MLNIGPQELLIVLIIALVVVGPQRLPELGRTIGKALRELRKIQDDVKDTIRFDLDDEPEPYVRPRKSPRAPSSDGNGEMTAKDGAAASDAPEPSGSVLPDDAGRPTTEGSPETEVDPEPRAVE
jgi:sec-independent protein translocase protein TatB